MHSLTFAIAALSTTAAAASVGKAGVTNNCDFPVYLWSVGSSVSDVNEIAPGKTYAEGYERDPVTGGRVLKITTEEDGLYNGSPQTNFAYTLDPEKVWYDLSDVFGSTFGGYKLTVEASDEKCDSIVWDDGTQPGGSQVKDCSNESSTTLTLCA